MNQIEERHRRMRDALAGLWEARMRPRYASPGARLQDLRRRAIELDRDQAPGALDAVGAAALEEAREAIAAQGRFQRDFDAECARLARKRDIELDTFMKERRRRRSVMCRSQIVSPRGFVSKKKL
jgi:hypothetical protein